MADVNIIQRLLHGIEAAFTNKQYSFTLAHLYDGLILIVALTRGQSAFFFHLSSINVPLSSQYTHRVMCECWSRLQHNECLSWIS